MRNNKYGDGKEALLAATVAVVAERGLHGLTFRAVSEVAQVNNTLISHHFGTKDTLLHEAVAWAISRAIRLSDLSAAETIDGGFARTLVELVEREPQLQLFQYEFVLESRRRPDLRDEAKALYEGYIDALQRALGRQGHVNSRPLARAVFAALDGLVFQQLTVADPDAVREAIETVGALLEANLAAIRQ
ncbi:TetR/AcrR family transcriptional regulator [Arthrobacter sp. MYb211]|uniref:TetR/AcrR family transcriptional regulator n=1 Tax=Micrococcaceae TaxID=1268 RepID=UPI000BB67F5F|nr:MULTISPECIES: TetR family transcriptional regulator [Micrococcaceae]PCC27697.1 TetR family transcriptional regulator [Glutamicibacter sp. BW80]PQZ96571.1 TetR/AcrR family transcriptional regulator [Arthrobacter sp. MYb224]PRA02023.1 TetR/AcrR family transcriptional regulator [Arthrobacter sp. MYb229]PRA13147.1 TetR/AcrR family transcriptional regulator [Arthrobacter sp. MYb221]PRB50743.1 TetR/AcrR family transcriptional regulator [Arthrobacter sp. MYb216]